MITDELERLAALHRAGSLTDAEFAAAKERLLGSTAAPDDDAERNHAVTRLDVAWMKTQQDYSRWRRGYLPTENTALQIYVGSGVLLVLGVLGAAASLNSRKASPEGLFVFVVVIVATIVLAIHEVKRTRRYLTAERSYRLQRGRIFDGEPNWNTFAATVEVRPPDAPSPPAEPTRATVEPSAPQVASTAETTDRSAAPPPVNPMGTGFSSPRLP